MREPGSRTPIGTHQHVQNVRVNHCQCAREPVQPFLSAVAGGRTYILAGCTHAAVIDSAHAGDFQLSLNESRVIYPSFSVHLALATLHHRRPRSARRSKVGCHQSVVLITAYTHRVETEVLLPLPRVYISLFLPTVGIHRPLSLCLPLFW